MRAIHLPEINLRYWFGITLASIFGTNMGDLYAHESGLGILPGLAVLAGLCALVFVAERIDRGSRELYYWLVIIIIRIGATNIADYTAYRLRIPEIVLNGGLMLLIGAIALWQERAAARSAAGRLPATGTAYWVAMLAAGVLGTALGDVCEHSIGEGPAAIGLGAVLVAVLAWRRGAVGPFYWLIVAVARTAGTAIGDWLAENHSIAIGLTWSTTVTGLAFVLLLALWRGGSAAVSTGARPAA